MQLENELIFILSPQNYQSITTIAFESNSIDVFISSLQFFKTICLIEIGRQYDLHVIWETIFTLISFNE